MYLFLDIDGVLNKESQWKHPYYLDKKCLQAFCNTAKSLKADVILISSWRTGFEKEEKEKETPQIKELEEAFAEHGVKITDKTPQLRGRTRQVLTMHSERRL